MKKIGIVSCNRWKNKIKEDLMLQKALLRDGYDAEIISWEDETIQYESFNGLILRSVWGYQNNYINFVKWINKVSVAGIKLFNVKEILLNNIRKDKQFHILDKNFISHIPTQFIKSISELQNTELKFPIVIKPIISGSGENTYKFDSVLEMEGTLFRTVLERYFENKENGIMLQPYYESISNGEYACIYINGINTHNMLRFPGVLSKKQYPLYLERIPKEVENISNAVSKIPEFKDYLYMRIDIIVTDNIAYIMEVELTEPDLMFKYILDKEIQNKAINQFAKSLERRL